MLNAENAAQRLAWMLCTDMGWDIDEDHMVHFSSEFLTAKARTGIWEERRQPNQAAWPGNYQRTRTCHRSRQAVCPLSGWRMGPLCSSIQKN